MQCKEMKPNRKRSKGKEAGNTSKDKESKGDERN